MLHLNAIKIAWTLIALFGVIIYADALRQGFRDRRYLSATARDGATGVFLQTIIRTNALLLSTLAIFGLLGVAACFIPEPIRQENRLFNNIAGLVLVVGEAVFGITAFLNRRDRLAVLRKAGLLPDPSDPDPGGTMARRNRHDEATVANRHAREEGDQVSVNRKEERDLASGNRKEERDLASGNRKAEEITKPPLDPPT